MKLLSPFGLFALLSVPVLLWLWRLAASRRRLTVASLIPFEHLLKRPALHRSRLRRNLLFWLQLAALAGLAAALAQPVLERPPSRTILAILDTSASMAARRGGSSAFTDAQRALRRHLAAKRPTDQYFLMTTAPVAAVTSQPTADTAALLDLLRDLHPGDLAGNVATAVRLGTGLLGSPPSQLVVVTDEPAPSRPLPATVEWISVGRPLDNVAIVGFDAQGPLCGPEASRVVVTVQNFGGESAPVGVRIAQRGTQLAETRVILPPDARASVALALPDAIVGWVAVSLDVEARHDALAVDNAASIRVRQAEALPVVVLSQRPAFRQAIGRWLRACEGLVWMDGPVRPPLTVVAVTDDEELHGPHVVGALHLVGRDGSGPAATHWVVQEPHPIGAYLPSIQPVGMAWQAPTASAWGDEPIVWALRDGLRQPLASVGVRDGRRIVSLALDPVAAAEAPAAILLFLNSLRWLMGQTELLHTGQPIVLPALPPGLITIHRPDGAMARVDHAGGTFQYGDTTRAGHYQVVQGETQAARAVNFLDPVESNVRAQPSSWHPSLETLGGNAAVVSSVWPMARWVVAALLVLLLVEWWLYCARGSSTVHSPQTTEKRP